MTTPERVGKYQILSKIADGGMAEVFLAVLTGDEGFQKRVALKMILPFFARDESFVRSFINEARICGQLQHPNLVQVYEFDNKGDSLYLAMEFIDGLDLERIITHQKLKRKPLPPNIVAEIVLQMLEGLEYAHNATNMERQPLNVVHRDLKPSNVLIDQSGFVKIVDFGVAKASNNLYKTINQGTAKGTVSYMSPEQASGKTDLGPASDLFSVGTILYEMLSGDRMFDGENLFAILDSVRSAPLETYITSKHIPPIFQPILRKALTRELSGRYQNAREMAREMRHAFPDLPGPSALSRFVEQLRSEGLEIAGIPPLSENRHARATQLSEVEPQKPAALATRPALDVDTPDPSEATEWSTRRKPAAGMRPAATNLAQPGASVTSRPPAQVEVDAEGTDPMRRLDLKALAEPSGSTPTAAKAPAGAAGASSGAGLSPALPSAVSPVLPPVSSPAGPFAAGPATNGISTAATTQAVVSPGHPPAAQSASSPSYGTLASGQGAVVPPPGKSSSPYPTPAAPANASGGGAASSGPIPHATVASAVMAAGEANGFAGGPTGGAGGHPSASSGAGLGSEVLERKESGHRMPPLGGLPFELTGEVPVRQVAAANAEARQLASRGQNQAQPNRSPSAQPHSPPSGSYAQPPAGRQDTRVSQPNRAELPRAPMPASERMPAWEDEGPTSGGREDLSPRGAQASSGRAQTGEQSRAKMADADAWRLGQELSDPGRWSRQSLPQPIPDAGIESLLNSPPRWIDQDGTGKEPPPVDNRAPAPENVRPPQVVLLPPTAAEQLAARPTAPSRTVWVVLAVALVVAGLFAWRFLHRPEVVTLELVNLPPHSTMQIFGQPDCVPVGENVCRVELSEKTSYSIKAITPDKRIAPETVYTVDPHDQNTWKINLTFSSPVSPPPDEH